MAAIPHNPLVPNPADIARWNKDCKQQLFCKVTALVVVLIMSIGAISYGGYKLCLNLPKKVITIASYAAFLAPVLVGVLIHYNRKKNDPVSAQVAVNYLNPILIVGAVATWLLFAPFAFLNQRFDKSAYYLDTKRYEISDKLTDERVTFEEIAHGYGLRTSIIGTHNDWGNLIRYGFIKEDAQIDETPIHTWLIDSTKEIARIRKRLHELEVGNRNIAILAGEASLYVEGERSLPQEYQNELNKITAINNKWNDYRRRVCYQYKGVEGSRTANCFESFFFETSERIIIPPERYAIERPREIQI